MNGDRHRPVVPGSPPPPAAPAGLPAPPAARAARTTPAPPTSLAGPAAVHAAPAVPAGPPGRDAAAPNAWRRAVRRVGPPRGRAWPVPRGVRRAALARAGWAGGLAAALALVTLGAQAGRDAACAAGGVAGALGSGGGHFGASRERCSAGGPPGDAPTATVSPREFAGAAACGAYLDVTGPGGTVRVQVVGECPACAPGVIDLSGPAFARIAVPGVAVVPVRYHPVRNPALPRPLAVRVARGSSARWLSVQAIDHGNALARVELRRGARWEPLARAGDHWVAGHGGGAGPFTLRVTDVYGQRVTASGILLAVEIVQRTGRRLYPAAPAPPAGWGRVPVRRPWSGGAAPGPPPEWLPPAARPDAPAGGAPATRRPAGGPGRASWAGGAGAGGRGRRVTGPAAADKDTPRRPGPGAGRPSGTGNGPSGRTPPPARTGPRPPRPAGTGPGPDRSGIHVPPAAAGPGRAARPVQAPGHHGGRPGGPGRNPFWSRGRAPGGPNAGTRRPGATRPGEEGAAGPGPAPSGPAGRTGERTDHADRRPAAPGRGGGSSGAPSGGPAADGRPGPGRAPRPGAGPGTGPGAAPEAGPGMGGPGSGRPGPDAGPGAGRPAGTGAAGAHGGTASGGDRSSGTGRGSGLGGTDGPGGSGTGEVPGGGTDRSGGGAGDGDRPGAIDGVAGSAVTGTAEPPPGGPRPFIALPSSPPFFC
ncbi:hypothetical protein Sru01_09510 [Sphaerisporangium rufum]|uniref:Expansin-like EG45 domain-containing protein n=1 Tax=Sphaerisporangium rufum TaxID=1381558 RepID=A0A919QXJ4_9ACTN|nr:expansin EXLX1 family cellulose-binding protein [Sphaerisporangium rufum]GII75969.1 hypothetical protein Sru01_09510 [Sphaerisporangium rufum]